MKYELTSFVKGTPVFPLEWQAWLASPATGDRVFDEVHREALFHWVMGEFYEAHESWEQLWRGQENDSAMRRALQMVLQKHSLTKNQIYKTPFLRWAFLHGRASKAKILR